MPDTIPFSGIKQYSQYSSNQNDLFFISETNVKMNTKNRVFILFLTVLSLVKISSQQLQSLKILSEWKEMEFEFPSRDIRESAILNKNYIPGNSVPIDIDIDYRGNWR